MLHSYHSTPQRDIPFDAALNVWLVAATTLVAPSLQSQIIIIRRTEEAADDGWINVVQRGRHLPPTPLHRPPSSWAPAGWNNHGFVAARRVHQPWHVGPVLVGAGGGIPGGGADWKPLWIPLDGRHGWRPQWPPRVPSSTPTPSSPTPPPPPSPPPLPPPPPPSEEPKPTAESNQQEPPAKQAVSTESPGASGKNKEP
ncbi:uncharacterized protein LOC119381725 [Rhipicephalus sanguineus]|uniref:uncharacterized protein LOC119376945 n=1 Tax=Rhipicephalus sanguineus TaxID=34632 RepID=UPI00189618D2|nr:uncharacterized protein LOC119376945 [Rhipicephalus sanguineus]XP_037505420.1 uncharacterized protein LOC119381725 [Rhipicephalus sanguineus]